MKGQVLTLTLVDEIPKSADLSLYLQPVPSYRLVSICDNKGKDEEWCD